MHAVIFEGRFWHELAPFSLSRPVFMMLCGAGTLLDKHLRHLRPSRLTLWVRPEMEEFCHVHVAPHTGVPTEVNTPLNDEPALLIPGRNLHLAPFEVPPAPAVFPDEQGLVRLAHVSAPGLAPIDPLEQTDRWRKLLDLPQTMSQTRMVRYPWDLISWNEEALIADFVGMGHCGQNPPKGPFCLIEPSSICLGQNVKIGAGAVLDASRGPIILGASVMIGANAVLEGPCYVGHNSTISPLANIRPGTSIGPMCKIGGEVSSSIVLGYSNKVHEGFLGDSYIGQWVNLGAGTTTSNLKNTYGQVSIPFGGSEIETGRRFLGSLIGDHAKIAIGTRLMTGSYVGFGSSIATSKLPPRMVPSMQFLTDAGTEAYDPERAKQVMQAVYERRQRPWLPSDEAIMKYVMHAAPTIEATI